MTDITQRIDEFRKLMTEHKIDTYILTKFDPHQSEDAGTYYNLPSYFSGFSGSNGKLVITKDNLYIFTDARYYQQTEIETSKYGYTLVKEGEKDSVPFLDFAYDITPENGVIGFSAETLSVFTLRSFLNKLKAKDITLNTDDDLISKVYTDRAFPITKNIFELDVKYAGLSRCEKIRKVQDELSNKKACAYILSSLDDIAYTLNLRGFDVEYNTFFASYLIFENDKTTLFVDLDKIKDVKEILEKDNITVLSYSEIFNYIEKMPAKTKTVINVKKTCYEIYNKGSHLTFIEDEMDITEVHKSIKSETEIKNAKNAYIRDAVALLRAVKRVKQNCTELTELSVAEILYEERSKNELFLMESFHPICGYNENGAMMHYHATPERFSKLSNEGMLLIDSGATYYDGTTDMTRTICLGETTAEMKHDFTLVLKSHIAVATAKFVQGSTGGKIDAIARTPLWNVGRNFAHGTGHGIAFVGPVHEGPQNMGFKDNGVPLQENMFVTNEPGLYVDGKFGIRTENIVRVIPFMESIDGAFFQFETLAFFPIDINLINKDMLTSEELSWINNYHKEVFEKLSPFVSGDDLEFLKAETKCI